MPEPIAISRTSPEGSTPRRIGASGSMMSGSNGILGTSFAGASSGSFREAIAASFGKDAADMMDYSLARFSSSTASTDSNMTALPSTSLPRTKMENTFCSNFKCCGKALENLHDLLQHYEEAHVKFEDDDVPAMISDDDVQSPTSSSTASQPSSPKSSNASATSNTNESAIDADDNLSAFDTTVMRSPYKGKKRSFGQFASNGSNNGQVHQSLRRALIDGGLGRSNSRSSSVYSANSPFSTPGGSIPGTPTADSEMDSAFFGSGSGAPAFSSLSLRNSGEDHDLPSCAPPNLFFPAASSSTALSTNGILPPSKREKTASMANSSSALDSSFANPGAMEDRPYKCTSAGCDKAYKQMNGLKYHRLHGQCNQNNLSPQQQVNAVVMEKVNGMANANANGDGENLMASSSSSGPTSPSSDNEEGSPSASSPESKLSIDSKTEKVYICQVGACGKRYKNLNGLRYHYLHSGSHGLLGLQLLHSNGGGPSARADAATGRPAISTNDLSSDALAAAAQAAAAHQQIKDLQNQVQQQQAASLNTESNSTAATTGVQPPSISTAPSSTQTPMQTA